MRADWTAEASPPPKTKTGMSATAAVPRARSLQVCAHTHTHTHAHVPKEEKGTADQPFVHAYASFDSFADAMRSALYMYIRRSNKSVSMRDIEVRIVSSVYTHTRAESVFLKSYTYLPIQ